MAKVLVTGANGFVGSHIVESLIAQKHEVTCIVRKSSNLRWINTLPLFYKYGDLNNQKFLETCVKDADVVIHCAGTVRAMDQAGYFKINVEGTKKLCKAVLKNNPKLKKFIFISSHAAIGPGDSKEFKATDAEPTPVSDYGLSKIEAEKQVKKLLSGNVPYTIIRPGSVYGPRDKDIFIFFNLVHFHLRPYTSDGRLFQLAFVKDVADGVCLCIDNKKSNDKTYYFANEKPYTWEQAAKVIGDSVGIKTIPVPVPDFIFKIAGFFAQTISNINKKPAVLNNQKITELLQKYWLGDNSQAKKDLGIEFTKLEIASKITYNWYLKNKYF